MISPSTFYKDRQYRYTLERIWDKNKPYVLFIMINPSTANEINNDNTINKINNNINKNIYGGFYIGNIYPIVSSSQRALNKNFKNTFSNSPEYTENIINIKKMILLVDKVIYAWGYKGKEPEWLREIVNKTYCINTLKNNQPAHPLKLISFEFKQYRKKY